MDSGCRALFGCEYEEKFFALVVYGHYVYVANRTQLPAGGCDVEHWGAFYHNPLCFFEKRRAQGYDVRLAIVEGNYFFPGSVAAGRVKIYPVESFKVINSLFTIIVNNFYVILTQKGKIMGGNVAQFIVALNVVSFVETLRNVAAIYPETTRKVGKGGSAHKRCLVERGRLR